MLLSSYTWKTHKKREQLLLQPGDINTEDKDLILTRLKTLILETQLMLFRKSKNLCSPPTQLHGAGCKTTPLTR